MELYKAKITCTATGAGWSATGTRDASVPSGVFPGLSLIGMTRTPGGPALIVAAVAWDARRQRFDVACVPVDVGGSAGRVGMAIAEMFDSSWTWAKVVTTESAR